MTKELRQIKNEQFIIFLITIACFGLTIESILLDWEFWVPPLVIIGTVFLWIAHISGKPGHTIRIHYYFVYAILTVFFHGVHETSFFDAAIVMATVIIAFSFLDCVYMLHIFFFEYIAIMIIQTYLAIKHDSTPIDSLNISRIILHVVFLFMIYMSCVKAIRDRIEDEETDKEKDSKIEAYEADMEDFLSNISHELRTPVNVVNGMSDLMIKRDAGEEAYSIKDAGIRLAYQIEDIQDYTECKRKKVLLEEEDYMSVSLINDVVMNFRLVDDDKNLELVVDMAPEVPSMMRGDIKKLHKIFRYLLQNAVKFTKQGGIYVKLNTEKMDYGVNLCIEVTDTGVGMDRRSIASVSEGMYQADKRRNRNSGGIGLGLFIVYGFVHKMGGFVKIESEKGFGTTVRVTVPQTVVDKTSCMTLSKSFVGDILFHVRSDKYSVPKVRDFYRSMAVTLASGIHVPLYSAENVQEIERLMKKLNVSAIFMGQEEYEEHPAYFDELAKGDVVVAVSAAEGFTVNPGSEVVVMPKPLYAYPIIRILNDGKNAKNIELANRIEKPSFDGIRALVVDDEPMNLVVATGLFKDYGMTVDTANSGKDAITKYRNGEYDIVFMDHMMPEMDGVESMQHIKRGAEETDREVFVVVLTANVVSGAKEMFMQEGFDGFIAKPIDTKDFEHAMLRLFPERAGGKGDAE